MGQAADTYLQRRPYAYTSFQIARSPIDYTTLDGGTHVRIFSHTFLKKHLSEIFSALSEGPLGSTPASPDSTSKLTKDFTQALPTHNVTPTSTTCSDSPPRFTYPTIFFLLSTSILTKGFTQTLPRTTSPLQQHRIRIPLLALRT